MSPEERQAEKKNRIESAIKEVAQLKAAYDLKVEIGFPIDGEDFNPADLLKKKISEIELSYPV